MYLWKQLSFFNKNVIFSIRNLQFYFKPRFIYLVVDYTKEVNLLFKYIAGRRIPGYDIKFDYFIDDYQIDDVPFFSKYLVGFVEEENYLHHNMTPFETFCFYYKLKKDPRPITEANKIISLLGLHGEANNIIRKTHQNPNVFLEKRVNLGIELIKKPQLIFLENFFNKLSHHEIVLFQKILIRIKHLGITMVMTTSKPRVSEFRLAGYIYFIYKTEFLFTGTYNKFRSRIKDVFKIANREPIGWFLEELDLEYQKLKSFKSQFSQGVKSINLDMFMSFNKNL